MWLLVAALLAPDVLASQPAAGEPFPSRDRQGANPDQPQADQEATEAQEARVTEVRGDVKHAPIGTSPLDKAAWLAVKVDNRLSAGTLIRTGLRSRVVLQFGDETVVEVRRATLASIDQFYRSATEQTVRLGLGYGVIRGGSTEGRLRSDVVVDSPVATLAKRGTDQWEISVGPHTGRFRISLLRAGMLEALAKLTNKRRNVRPGEYANDSNIAQMWTNQDVSDRHVKLFAKEGVSAADEFASANRPGGLGALGPGAGTEVRELSRLNDPAFTRNLIARRSQGPAQPLPVRPLFVPRAEGNFGFGSSFSFPLSNLNLPFLRRVSSARSNHPFVRAPRR